MKYYVLNLPQKLKMVKRVSVCLRELFNFTAQLIHQEMHSSMRQNVLNAIVFYAALVVVLLR